MTDVITALQEGMDSDESEVEQDHSDETSDTDIAENIEGNTEDLSRWAMGSHGDGHDLTSVRQVHDTSVPAQQTQNSQVLRIEGPAAGCFLAR